MSTDALDFATHRNLLVAEVVRTFGEMQLQVTGSSMLPTFWPGDLVRIERRQFASLTPGEIVFYLRDGRLFLHRLAAKHQTGHEESLITRGDAMSAEDPAVPATLLLGVATAVLRRGQWIQPRKVQRLLRWVVASSALIQRILLRFHFWWEHRFEAPLAASVPAKG
jgi:signal peptidase I